MPGVRALNHPAFLQRCEAFWALWTGLHFAAPSHTMLGHPRIEVVIALCPIRTDRAQRRKIVRRTGAEPLRGGDTIIEACTGYQESHQQPQRIHARGPPSRWS